METNQIIGCAVTGTLAAALAAGGIYCLSKHSDWIAGAICLGGAVTLGTTCAKIAIGLDEPPKYIVYQQT